MTKKDYIKIADVIVNCYNEQVNYLCRPVHLNPIIDDLTGKFIIMLRDERSEFNEKKFKAYINKKIGKNIIS